MGRLLELAIVYFIGDPTFRWFVIESVALLALPPAILSVFLITLTTREVRAVKRFLLFMSVCLLLGSCALIPVKPVRERRTPKAKCEEALIFYGDPRTGEVVGSRWGKICSDGSIR